MYIYKLDSMQFDTSDINIQIIHIIAFPFQITKTLQKQNNVNNTILTILTCSLFLVMWLDCNLLSNGTPFLDWRFNVQ